VDGCKLLEKLDNFPNSILVAGCQRSGTTAVSRLITESEGMTKFWFGKDDELDAALILAGRVQHNNKGRYCFQTTYLDNNYYEYLDHNGYKLIWVIRNPFSVIYSMLSNWKIAALNRLFKNCGSQLLESREKEKYRKYGILSISKIKRACLSYNAKVSQVFDLKKSLNYDALLIIDYDDLVQNKNELLPFVYNFLNLDYQDKYAMRLNSHSIGKANFSKESWDYIESTCLPVYKEAKKLLTVQL
jgi:hypothetical protein